MPGDCRLFLDEAWPAGATLATVLGGKPYVGLCRHLQAAVKPHNDLVERDLGCSVQDLGLKGQLAVNVYLEVGC